MIVFWSILLMVIWGLSSFTFVGSSLFLATTDDMREGWLFRCGIILGLTCLWLLSLFGVLHILGRIHGTTF